MNNNYILLLLVFFGCSDVFDDEAVYGCTDQDACNYNKDATEIWEGSCEYSIGTCDCNNYPIDQFCDCEGNIDSDFDGVEDYLDICPNTLANSQVDASGCASNQRDNDSDGVVDSFDQCPSTPLNTVVDQTGCEVTADGGSNSTDSSGSDADDDSMPGFEADLFFISILFAMIVLRRRTY